MTAFTRRRFGQGIGGILALAVFAARGTLHAASRTHEVRITGFAFTPPVLTVDSGDAVIWRNEDLAPHTASGAGWDTGRLALGEQVRLTFATPGTHDYVCAFHPQMTGRLIVRPEG